MQLLDALASNRDALDAAENGSRANGVATLLPWRRPDAADTDTEVTRIPGIRVSGLFVFASKSRTGPGDKGLGVAVTMRGERFSYL